MFWQDPLIFWSIMVNFLINYQCAVRKQAEQKEKNKNGQVRIYLEAKRRCTMSEKMIENNRVSVIGEIVSGFTFSHEVFGEGFYMVDVAVNRLSEQADIIVMGTRGRKGIDLILFGSVAEKVVKNATCPVLTIRPTDDD